MTMTKVIHRVTAAALVALLCLTSCKPAGVRDSVYDLGVSSLKVADQYLDFGISAEEAVEKLGEIDMAIEEYSLSDQEGSISYNVGMLQVFIGFKYSDALKYRNDLAANLGKSKR